MTVVWSKTVLSNCVGDIRFVVMPTYAKAAGVNTIAAMQKENAHKSYSFQDLPSTSLFNFRIEDGERVDMSDATTAAYQKLPVVSIVLDIQGRQPTITDASQIHFEMYTLWDYF